MHCPSSLLPSHLSISPSFPFLFHRYSLLFFVLCSIIMILSHSSRYFIPYLSFAFHIPLLLLRSLLFLTSSTIQWYKLSLLVRTCMVFSPLLYLHLFFLLLFNFCGTFLVSFNNSFSGMMATMSNIKLDSNSLVIGPLSEAAANRWNSFVG